MLPLSSQGKRMPGLPYVLIRVKVRPVAQLFQPQRVNEETAPFPGL